MANDIPISNALDEADPLSIQELFSRSPIDMSDKDIDRIIDEMRALRDKMESSPTGRTRSVRVKPTTIRQVTQFIDNGSSPEDYGL